MPVGHTAVGRQFELEIWLNCKQMNAGSQRSAVTRKSFFRTGHWGFAVLQCIFKSYFKAILTVKLIHLLARPIKITYHQSISLTVKFLKILIFMKKNN